LVTFASQNKNKISPFHSMYKHGHKVTVYLWVNEAWEILILKILTILIFSMFVVLCFFSAALFLLILSPL